MRRDAAVFIVGLAVLCGLCVGVARILPAPGAVPGQRTAAAQADSTSHAALAAAGKAKGASPATPSVAKPWSPGQPQLGIDIYWQASPGEAAAVTDGKIRAALDYVISEGANAVSLSFPFFTTGVDSNTISADPGKTPTTSQVGLFVREAKAAGLYVALRPILDETVLLAQDSTRWRGTITPTNLDTWYANYTSFLLPYAQVAQSGHADALYIGTELSSMEAHVQHWHTLVDAVKNAYTGDLAYSINYNEMPMSQPRVAGTSPAVDAYFPMYGLGDNATVSQLVAGWNSWLDKYPGGDLSGLTISETGIVAENGAYQKPFGWQSDHPANSHVQEQWFTAACQVAQQRHVAGLYWWYLNLEAPANSSYPMGFQGTNAATVVAHCFSTYPRT